MCLEVYTHVFAKMVVVETPWPVCQVCSGIPVALFSPSQHEPSAKSAQTHFLHSSFQAFSLSASTGCHLCTVLYGAVREPFKSRLRTAPVFLESCLQEDDLSVIVSADLTRIQRSGGEDEAALREGVFATTDRPFRHTTIADVKFTFASEKVPATAKNYKGMLMR